MSVFGSKHSRNEPGAQSVFFLINKSRPVRRSMCWYSMVAEKCTGIQGSLGWSVDFSCGIVGAKGRGGVCVSEPGYAGNHAVITAVGEASQGPGRTCVLSGSQERTINRVVL